MTPRTSRRQPKKMRKPRVSLRGEVEVFAKAIFIMSRAIDNSTNEPRPGKARLEQQPKNANV
jgi:hypothetical protein